MKSPLNVTVLSIALLFVSVTSFAIPQGAPLSNNTINYLSLHTVEITDLTSEYAAMIDLPVSLPPIVPPTIPPLDDFNPLPIGSSLDQVELILDQIINIGQKIWNIIEKGKPVDSFTSTKASALPANTQHWAQLENWKAPQARVIRVAYKNSFGMEVVRFTYRIILLPGGSVKGVGKYIGYAKVEPVEMSTAYLYTFNAKAEVDAVYNLASHKNPLAGMILNVNWTIETLVKKTTVTHTYTLDGLGNITTPAETFQAINNLK